VLAGALQHKDSMGNGRVLRPGEIQLMSAGRGVAHSEFNPSSSDPLHFLQIWIVPAERSLAPSYTEWKPDAAAQRASKVLVISPDGRDASARIHQDAFVFRVRLAAGESLRHELASGRGAWLQLASGSLDVGTTRLSAGDGASIEGAAAPELRAREATEALLFDLA
jgi:redox-sensitive bicupin YhaK (pirin superfamily)